MSGDVETSYNTGHYWEPVPVASKIPLLSFGRLLSSPGIPPFSQSYLASAKCVQYPLIVSPRKLKMGSPNPNRNTQFEMEGLRGAGQSTPVTEPESHAIEGQQTLQDHSLLKKKAPKRKRSLSPQTRGALKKPGISIYDHGVKDGSPWESYWKIFQLKFDSFVTVAVQKEPLRKRVVVKRLSGPEIKEQLQMVRSIRHNKIVNVLETFRFEGTFYVVLERMSISLTQVVASPPYPGEQELAAIAGQIFEGLAYLASRRLEHGSLSYSNILLSVEGDVKIANQECCREVAPSNNPGVKDVRALGGIVMELMQKYAKADGVIGIENLDRWPSDSAAVEFLSATTSASSAKELMKHRLLQCNWRKDWLEWMVD